MGFGFDFQIGLGVLVINIFTPSISLFLSELYGIVHCLYQQSVPEGVRSLALAMCLSIFKIKELWAQLQRKEKTNCNCGLFCKDPITHKDMCSISFDRMQKQWRVM